MAKGKIATLDSQIWHKAWFIDLPDDTARLLFIYLLTNGQRNCTGIYEMHLDTIAGDRKITRRKLKKYLDLFQTLGKISVKSGFIIVENAWEHNYFNTDNVRSFVIKHLTQDIPNSIKDSHKEIISLMLEKAGYRAD